jgi:hypothetical protein
MSEQQPPEAITTEHITEPGHRHFTFKAMQFIWLALVVLEILIGLRIVFKAIAFDPGNVLVGYLYGFTDLFLFPFASLMPTSVLGGTVLEIPSIIALVLYALLAGVAAKLVEVIFYRPVFWWVAPKTAVVSRETSKYMM